MSQEGQRIRISETSALALRIANLPQPLLLAIRGVSFLILLFAAVGVFLNKFTFRFVPDPEFAALEWPVAFTVGFVIGIPLAMEIWNFRIPGRESDMFYSASVLFAPFLIAYMFHLAFGIGLPAILARSLDDPHQFVFTVDDPNAHSSTECPRAISVRDTGGSDICGVPDSLRSKLTPGQRIIVSGAGTAIGIFWENIEASQE